MLVPVPKQLQALVKFWESTGNRDKTCRTIQYFAKFLAFYYASHQDKQDLVKRFESLSSNLSMSRKAFRLLKTIDFYVKLAMLWNKTGKQDPVALTLDSATNIFYGLYLACDSYTWAARIKLIHDPQSNRVTRQGNFFWLFAILSSLIHNGVKISMHWDKKRRSKEDARQVDQVPETLYVSLLKDAFDLLIPLSLNQYGPWYPNSGLCGLLGTVSSLLGVYQGWPSV